MPGVTMQNVSRHFGQVAAVDGINLRIEQGEFVTLLGPSGCGKTTTLRMVAGLEQNTSGRIMIGDTVVSDCEAGFYLPPDRRQLGMVFQSYAIWPHMTVFDNIAYPLRIRRRPADEIRKRVTNALRLVEMEPFRDRPAPALSGGQQQRVAIARALVFEPKVLLLDEPLSNLDARLRTQMGDEFRALQKRLGITTLYVTHDQEEAMSLSDKVVVMHAGRILQIGAPENIYYRPANDTVAAFLGSSNLLDARVRDCRSIGPGRFEVHVEGDDWMGRCYAGTELAAGERVSVMIRSQSFHMHQGGRRADGDRISWSGQVVQSIFRGATRSLTIQTSTTKLNMETSSLAKVEIGQQIEVSAPIEAAWAMRKQRYGETKSFLPLAE